MSNTTSLTVARVRWWLLRPLLERTGAIAMVFRRWEPRAARTPGGDFDDQHPMPPPDLLVAVAGTSSREAFSVLGRRDADLFAELAARHGLALADRRVVADFGCGCGRIARWLAPRVIGGGGRFLGFDLNPRLTDWCAANLPGAYARNRLKPPLPCADGAVDVLYAYSVFTHLRQPTAVAWLGEIARVLRPGGLALLTFHDEAYAQAFGTDRVRAALTRQSYFVLHDALEGSNYISAWTTRAHFAELASGRFEVLEIRAGRDDMSQAVAVLRKR